jgi:hypothetical protein
VANEEQFAIIRSVPARGITGGCTLAATDRISALRI